MTSSTVACIMVPVSSTWFTFKLHHPCTAAHCTWERMRPGQHGQDKQREPIELPTVQVCYCPAGRVWKDQQLSRSNILICTQRRITLGVISVEHILDGTLVHEHTHSFIPGYNLSPAIQLHPCFWQNHGCVYLKETLRFAFTWRK